MELKEKLHPKQREHLEKIKPELPKGTAVDFFCEKKNCWMTYRACAKRQALIKTSAELKRMISPEDCIDCPQGDEAKKALADKEKKKVSTPCLWPGCEKPAAANGLCSTCSRKAAKNQLIYLNTADASPEALEGFIQDLAHIHQKHGLPIPDIATALSAMGVTIYKKRTGID
jgi:hypothetical protein